MNKNDKFHNADFEVNAHAISDDELDAVAGGCEYRICPHKYTPAGKNCPKCGSYVDNSIYDAHVASCNYGVYNDFGTNQNS